MILTDLANSIDVFFDFENLNFWPMLSYFYSNVFWTSFK